MFQFELFSNYSQLVIFSSPNVAQDFVKMALTFLTNSHSQRLVVDLLLISGEISAIQTGLETILTGITTIESEITTLQSETTALQAVTEPIWSNFKVGALDTFIII